MNRSEALEALKSDSPTSRLRAARRLLDVATSEDQATLAEIYARETDSWTRKMIDRVLLRLVSGSNHDLRALAIDDSPEDELVSELQAQSLQVATKRLVHEIRPLLMAAFVSAKSDLADGYANSSTETRLVLIDDYLVALEHLGEAASAPQSDDLDLTQVVADCSIHHFTDRDRVLLARTDSVIARADRRLIQLALVNLIRNAVEASVEVSEPIVVNWASTPAEAWIAVIDRGIGLPVDGFSAARIIGTTSKGTGHFGLGLPIAAQAAESLGGELTLRPNSSTGTIAELRWPQ